jgi:hypothetical protein
MKAFALQVHPVSLREELIQDGIGDGGVSDVFMPFSYLDLGGDPGAGALVFRVLNRK